MEFLQLHAEDDDSDIEMEEAAEEENEEDRKFMDDSENVSFSNSPPFHRNVDNNFENAINDSFDFLIDKDSQVKNYMLRGLIKSRI